MRPLATVALTTIAIGMAPTAALGQAPETDGMWFGVGAAYGMTMLSCGICTNDIRTGPSVQLKAGGKLSQAMLFGGEASGWMKRLEGVDQMVFSLHAMGYLFAAGTPGLFFKGGIGPTWFIANDREDDGDLTSLGVSVQLGAGYEARVGSRTAVTPYINVFGSGFGKLRFEDRVASDQFGVAQVQIGLSLTKY